MSQQPIPIDLALQGGGAHGAFTWGVLDRLLEDERIIPDGISGTSAGAMNAVVLAHGFASGGRDGARAALRDFWQSLSNLARFSPLQRTPLDRALGKWTMDNSPGYQLFGIASSLVSPYQFNPFDINPLRELVAAKVDFERVRACRELHLFVSATNVRTGRARTFRRHEISLDVVMASACLPQIFRAVEIDGDPYWDGGYMGNPALFPLIDDTAADDIMIVQINPTEREELPRTAADIQNRLNEITFNASLVKEVATLRLLKRLVHDGSAAERRYARMCLHHISAEQELRSLDISSKFNVEWDFLEYLHGVGRAAMDGWLARHAHCLGRESTLKPSHLLCRQAGFDVEPGLRESHDEG
ncbi:patatin-like phospholipase family protein [Noviherbaspirillum pedocola]|uniref:Patatin-like phospholipase family protein n=1 Tax=Noviherbaspirillum pedocola TaxID=2801341 RepID=A0A934T022_9BURK|nr:patatin-like phospholipase family protein [Noviherbaspirillum pedocola]MBK4738859.1 patatin-like phospholipase family protein [Noviherbaspirillum pedocola]